MGRGGHRTVVCPHALQHLSTRVVLLAPLTQCIPLSTNTIPQCKLRGPLHGPLSASPPALILLSPQQGSEEPGQVVGGQHCWVRTFFAVPVSLSVLARETTLALK